MAITYRPVHAALSIIPRFILLLALLLVGCSRQVEHAEADAIRRGNAVEAMARQDVEGYTQALEPREFVFPEDHGPHPDFQTEWWYFTGHLDAEPVSGEEARSFGFQLTFFRSALAPDDVERSSPWATRQLYLAHFALGNFVEGRFDVFERLSRGAAGLAGAGIDPLRVFVDDWSFESREADSFPWRLRAAERAEDGTEIVLDIEVDSRKPMILQGDRGLSSKSQDPGNASYYYSYTRLDVAGTLVVGDRSYPVTGSAWLDREWSTSALSPNQVGWDWFALQLDDGRDLMHGQLRRRDGTLDSASYGTLVEADGTARHLDASAFDLEVLEWWTSPRTGTTYPAAWRLRLPDEDLDLELRPLLADQELDVSSRYWEGAIEVRGTSGGAAVGGRGYAELVGYDGQTPGGPAP